MPISVECPTCAARLKAPDAAAGKRVPCPKCRGVVIVPGNLSVSEPLQPSQPVEQRIPCPMCSELILPTAKKCKHCGSLLGPPEAQMYSGPVEPEPPPVHYQSPPAPVLIEQTGKQWKAMQLIGCIMVLVGGLLVVGACSGSMETETALRVLIIGAAVATLGRIGAWWYHG
jgi:hypothetical protein